MGLFGRQSKMDSDVETVEAVLPEQYEEVPELPTPLSTTTIAKGVTVTGTLHGEGIIQIEGTVEGEIDLTGAVVVKETGLVKGPVTADTIRVAGCISGDVVARDHMFLEKTGSLDGDVTTISLVVEDGGRFNGRSNMLRQEKGVPTWKEKKTDTAESKDA